MPHAARRTTPLSLILVLTFLASLGTGMLWNGIPFITEADYAFGEAENLLLYVCVGAVYVCSAMSAGPVQRRLERWMSPRAILAAVLVIQAGICVLPLLWRGAWVVWVITVIFSATSAQLWPIVESFLSSGRHGPRMRSAMGWWNVAWMAAVAAPLWLMAPLMTTSPRLAIVGLGVCLGAAAVPLLWFSPQPDVHDSDHARLHVSAEYPGLLHSARVLLLLSYVLLSAMAPLLPFILNRLDVSLSWQTPSAATWMISRVIFVAVMWRLAFWHGRWGTLLFGGVGMVGAFITIISAPSIVILLGGLALLGGSLGIVYFAALYYAMSVGSAAVDAGGRHEALIGVGYAVGPSAGLSALFAARFMRIGAAESSFEVLLIIIVCTLVGIGSVYAVIPYRRAVRRRRTAHITGNAPRTEKSPGGRPGL